MSKGKENGRCGRCHGLIIILSFHVFTFTLLCHPQHHLQPNTGSSHGQKKAAAVAIHIQTRHTQRKKKDFLFQ